ncbi:MAG TPA: hypothetical protein VGN76_06170, partial [Gemmatimonadales bacterium]|nr:hypothetical protein [Gemmatimonadales bacterium]
MIRTPRAVLTLFLAAAGAIVASAPPAGAQDQSIATVLSETYTKFKNLQEGKNADYIPALAKVDSKIFGIALVTT